MIVDVNISFINAHNGQVNHSFSSHKKETDFSTLILDTIEEDIYTCFPQGTALSLVKSKPGCSGSQLEPQARSWGCLSPWRGAALASNGKHISDWILSLVYPSKFKWDAHDHTGIPFGLVSGMDIYLLRSDEVKARLRSLENLFAAFCAEFRGDDEST